VRIKRLQVRNFRSIEQLDEELPQICALVGPNNSGKTNLMEAIRRVLAPDWGPRASHFSEDDVYLRDAERNIEIACTFEPPVPYARLKDADPVELHTLRFEYNRYQRGEQRGQRKLDQSCLDGRDQVPSVMTSYGRKGQQPKFERIIGVPAEVRDAIPLIHIGTNRSLREQLPGARNSLLRRILEGINDRLHDPAEVIRVSAPDGGEAEVQRLEQFRELISQAMELLKTDEFKRLEAAIKRNALEQLGLDPASDEIDLYFTPMNTMDFYKSLDLAVREGDFTISATEVGGGVQNAIVLSVLRAFEETRRSGAILLIEEPEMFLHPQMQRSLYRTFRRIGETNQVIYTTHSPHFVSVPEYREVFIVRKGEHGTHVTKSGLASDARRREKLIKELDPERNELFFAKRLLLVEGDTEKLALPVYAERLGLDLDRVGATLVEVGGKRSLKEFAELAISFGIPTGVVYDQDSSDFGRNQREQEDAYNADLDRMARPDGSVRVWRLTNKYEDVVRAAAGEAEYQRLCQVYPNHSKATRQRLIALDNTMPIPEQLGEILRWLAGMAEAA